MDCTAELHRELKLSIFVEDILRNKKMKTIYFYLLHRYLDLEKKRDLLKVIAIRSGKEI